MNGRAFFPSVLIALCLAATNARADDEKPLAQVLFDEARDLMASGEYAAACPKLEESQRLDPGGGTLLNLGACYEKLGRTASAWAIYQEALSVARKDGRDDRADEAQARIVELSSELLRLRLVVRSPKLEGLVISKNGTLVPRAAWGLDAPLDPGEYLIVAEAPGRRAFRTKVILGPKSKRVEVVVPDLEALPAPASAPPIVPTRPVFRDKTEEREVSIPGLVLIGVGAAGIGVGTYFGIRALDKKSKSDAICNHSVCPPDQSEAVTLHEQAVRAAWISDISFGVGIVSAGIGTYLVLTGKESSGSSRLSVGVSVGPGSVALSQSW